MNWERALETLRVKFGEAVFIAHEVVNYGTFSEDFMVEIKA